MYEVIVSNIGTVYEGGDKKKAYDTFACYENLSKDGYGKAGGESVVMMLDGEWKHEHYGENETDL